VFPVWHVLEAIADRQMHLCLALAIEFEFVRLHANFARDAVDRNRSRRLGDFDIGRDRGKRLLQSMRHRFCVFFPREPRSLQACSGWEMSDNLSYFTWERRVRANRLTPVPHPA